jgi:hypothetical protein
VAILELGNNSHRSEKKLIQHFEQKIRFFKLPDAEQYPTKSPDPDPKTNQSYTYSSV